MKLMIRLALAAAVAPALTACRPPPSRVETLPSSAQLAEPREPSAGDSPAPAHAHPAGPAAERSATPGPGSDRIAALEARLATLEADHARNAEALEFLGKVYEQQKRQQEARDRDELAQDGMFAVNIADNVKAGQVEGPASAPVTIVKAFDFACPYCYRAVATMEALRKDYRGKVRIVYMNLIVHPSAKPAHLASCAAAKQGKYNEFRRAFWDEGFAPYADSRDATKLGEDHILAIAKKLGLDTAKLKADMGSSACEARIQGDMQEMAKFHVAATPTFFINGRHVGGALPKEALAQIIDEQLEIVAASGVPGSAYYKKVVLENGEKQFRSKLDPKPN